MATRIAQACDTDREKHVSRLRHASDQITAINEEQERRSNLYHSRAQNLTVSYLLYQVIVFASLCGGSSPSAALQCHLWWVPFSISAIPAVLYFVALCDSLASYHEVQRQIDMYRIELERIRGLIHRVEASDGVVLEIDGEHVMRPDDFVVLKRLVCLWAAVLGLVGLTGVVLFSTRSMLCGR